MDVFSLLHRPSDREQLQRLQTVCSRYLAPYGLSLHPTQLQALLQSQRESLLQAGRVAWNDELLPQLLACFAGSPYLQQEELPAVLEELLALFYQSKNRLPLSDEALLRRMRRLFDGKAGGDTGFLADLLLQEDCP